MATLFRLHWRTIFVLSLAVLLCILVYFPGLDGKFIFDDWESITKNHAIRITNLGVDSILQAARSSETGPLGRPIAMVSFAVNYLLSGLDPFWFKLVNLGIHIATGLALFFLTEMLLRFARYRRLLTISRNKIRMVALLATAFWLIHPLQLTVVLYAVQRMAGLAAFFTALALISYCGLRIRQIVAGRTSLRSFALLLLWFLAAAFSKENGLLVPVFCLLLEMLFFRFRGADGRLSVPLVSAYSLMVVVVAFYLLTIGNAYINGYVGRDFDLGERLLTETRALWFYLKMLVLPSLADMTLYHDDFVVSRGFASPVSTLWSVIGVLGLLLIALLARTRYVLLSFAILFFFVAHLMESTVFPLELLFEHRNYLAIYGVLVWFGYVAVSLATDEKKRKVVILLVLVYLALLSFVTLQRAELWGGPSRLLAHWLYCHPDSARTNMWAASSFENGIEGASVQQAAEFQRRSIGYYRRAVELQPSMCSALVGIVVLQARTSASVDLKTLEATRDCLSRQPLQASTIHALRGLVEEVVDGSLLLPPVIVKDLFSAVLHRSDAAYRWVLLSNYATYLGGVLGDLQAGVKYSREAVNTAPQYALLWVQYARYLVAVGDLEGTKHALKMAEERDTGASREFIVKVRRLLRQAEAH